MLTSAANVMLLISTVGIITVLWRLIRCIKQTRMKFVGAFVGFAGACIMMSNAVVISGDIKPLLGDLLALFDAFLITSIYLILDPVLKAGIPSGVVSMVLTAVATIAYFIVCLFMYTFDFNPDTGIFGWLHPDHVLYVLIFVGFVNSIGNFTSYFTLKHLDLVTT
jgi:drug/metabolite transporter (DMT)-like permease